MDTACKYQEEEKFFLNNSKLVIKPPRTKALPNLKTEIGRFSKHIKETPVSRKSSNGKKTLCFANNV